MKYPSPCEKCEQNENCTRYRTCQPWLTRYLYRQKQINAYAKKALPVYYASLQNGGDVGANKQ